MSIPSSSELVPTSADNSPGFQSFLEDVPGFVRNRAVVSKERAFAIVRTLRIEPFTSDLQLLACLVLFCMRLRVQPISSLLRLPARVGKDEGLCGWLRYLVAQKERSLARPSPWSPRSPVSGMPSTSTSSRFSNWASTILTGRGSDVSPSCCSTTRWPPRNRATSSSGFLGSRQTNSLEIRRKLLKPFQA